MLRLNSFWSLATAATILATLIAPPYSLASASRTLNPPTREIAVVIAPSLRGDAALSLATQDLGDSLAALGLKAVVVDDDKLETLPAYAILVGDDSNRWIARLEQAKAVAIPRLADEGYTIKRARWGMQPILVVSGVGDLGSVYGLFGLVERIKLDPSILFGPINVVSEPKFKLRLVSTPTPPGTIYPSPEDALRWGFNAVAVEPWTRLPLFDSLKPPILDPTRFGTERAWVEASRERARKQIEAAKRLHLKVFTMGDVLSFPFPALSTLKEEVSLDNDPNRYCLAKPKTQQLLDRALDEVLTDFPDIDIIMVRTGENYVDGPISGNTPLEGSCSTAVDLSPADRLRLVLDIVRRQVVDMHGKTYIHRAWDLRNAGFHADPEFTAAVVNGVSPQDKMILSFKHTETDFWRYNAVNPNLGRGQLKQMVEFQVAREFEGKGAFPNYMGGIFASGGPEVKPAGGVRYAYERGVRAAWVWAKGGGWDGPYLKSDVWLEANTFAIGHLLWNPDLSPSSLALQWASLRFGQKAAPKVASVLLKSERAVLKGFYVEPYARRAGPWAPNNLWNRDDQLRGGNDVIALYRALATKGDFATALEERKEALRIVDSMIADFDAAMPLIPDRDLAETAYNSLLYEKALFEVFDDYLTGLFQYYRWLDGGKLDDNARRLAIDRLQAWEASWRRYNEVIPALTGTASLYRDAGMSQTALAALRDLGK